jgi:predicted small integral membrane protein
MAMFNDAALASEILPFTLIALGPRERPTWPTTAMLLSRRRFYRSRSPLSVLVNSFAGLSPPLNDAAFASEVSCCSCSPLSALTTSPVWLGLCGSEGYICLWRCCRLIAALGLRERYLTNVASVWLGLCGSEGYICLVNSAALALEVLPFMIAALGLRERYLTNVASVWLGLCGSEGYICLVNSAALALEVLPFMIAALGLRERYLTNVASVWLGLCGSEGYICLVNSAALALEVLPFMIAALGPRGRLLWPIVTS